MFWKISFFASFVWNWRRYFNLRLLSSQLNLSKNKSYSALESCYPICCCYRELLIQLQLDLHWKLELVNEWVAKSWPFFSKSCIYLPYQRKWQNVSKIIIYIFQQKIGIKKDISTNVLGIRLWMFLPTNTLKLWVLTRLV